MNSWITLPLGELCRFKAGSAFPQDEQGSTSGAYPFVKVSDLSSSANSKFLNSANNWISADQAASLRPTIAPEGAVLFAKIGEGLRSERCRVATRATAYDNNLMSAVALEKTCDPGFLFYLMQVVGLSDYAEGSALPYLKQSVLQKIPCTVPAVIEQRTIAEVLGALDDKIAANTKLAETADALAVSTFQRCLLNATYSESTFSDLAKVSGGGTPSTKVPEYWDGGIPWATPTDVTGLSGPYLEETGRSITEQGLAACASELYPADTILMTSRATIGAFALTQIPTAVNQGFIVVQAYNPSHHFWLFHEMRSRTDEFISMANGATFLELSRGNFKKFKVRLAPDEQMAAFNETVKVLHHSAQEALKENRTLAATRDALLPQLMSGKLRVKNIENTMGEMV